MQGIRPERNTRSLYLVLTYGSSDRETVTSTSAADDKENDDSPRSDCGLVVLYLNKILAENSLMIQGTGILLENIQRFIKIRYSFTAYSLQPFVLKLLGIDNCSLMTNSFE